VVTLTFRGDPLVEDVAWFRVDDPSVPGAARRAAASLADRVGFSAHRTAEIGVAATEVATNLLRHADEGAFLLRVVRWPGTNPGDGRLGGPYAAVPVPGGAAADFVAIEFVAVDAGPGMADIPAALRNGATSAGTLGVGMGAVARLSDQLDVHSTPGCGTVMAVRFLPRGGLEVARPEAAVQVEGLTRPMTGETICGDAYAVRAVGDTVAVLVCDGLGHGELAARASLEAARLFRDSPGDPTDPVATLLGIHRGISHTRGAAAAVAVLDPGANLLRFAGLGNISGVLVDGSGRTGLNSRPGIVGHQARAFREVRHPFGPDSLMVLHSDGVSPRWDLADHPGITTHGALVIAATILRDAGLRRDDACVVVARLTRGHGIGDRG
jgi:anti-sigma regulatory factor (Ser/Thr protein kinase)